MESLYSVKLGKLIQEFRLEVLRGGAGYEDVSIRTEDVNRPGLQLTGFFDYFDAKRLQVIGRVETTYLEGLTSEERRESFELLLSQDIPALIISREIEPFPECMEMAEKYDRTILRSPDTTSVLMSNIIAALKSYLAPRITRHGVLVEVYGEGVLLLGESGVGKSETAIELVKRGHRLIADDAVEIKRNVTDRLVGTAPALYRATGHRRHRRVPPVRYERRQGRGRDRYGHQPGAVEGRGHVRPPGPGEPLHHDSGRAGALSHRAGAAWPKPGGDHRGGGHEQPPQEDGVQRRRGVYQADQPALRPGHECAVE